MPLVETRRCKRYGTLEARRIRFRIFEVVEDDGDEVELDYGTFVPIVFEEDLSERAIDEAVAKISQAIKPPVKRPPKAPKKGDGDGK